MSTIEDFTQARRILRGAADLIETSGWARFLFETSYGEHCALGAIRKVDSGATYETAQSVLATKLVAQTLRDQGVEDDPEHDFSYLDPEAAQESRDFDLVTSWNDADERTAEEVVRVLREAGQG